jgi:hypothetical protein
MNEMNEVNQTQYFEIIIDGHLSDQRSMKFNDLQVDQLTNGKTLISGEFKDQAHLFGILILIRDMGIPLVAVNCPGSISKLSKEF